MKQYIALFALGLGIFSFAQQGPRHEMPQQKHAQKGPQKDFHHDDRGPQRPQPQMHHQGRRQHPEFAQRGPQRPPQPVPVMHAPSRPGIYIVIR